MDSGRFFANKIVKNLNFMPIEEICRSLSVDENAI